MNEETRLEVIKAIAYGENVEDIANMAEVDTAEIEKIRDDYANEINTRRKAMEEKDDGK